MKMIWKKALIIVTILGTVLTGCKKDDFLLDAEAADDDNKVATIEDDNTLASDFIATENVIGGRTESTEGNRFLGAANVSFDPITNIITIDFGTTNVLCSDGKNRRGKIYIKIEEGRPTNLPYTSVLTHENYFVNDNKVEGTRRERKIALSSTSTQTDITVTNRKVSFTDGTVLTKNVNHIRVKTVSTDGIMYATTGTSNGTNRRGKNYTTTILTPIISKTSCNNYLFPIQGTMNLGVNGDDTKFLLDFGNGTCDRTFTVTYNGRTKTITR
jgi:hypothetical protein